MKIIKTKIKDLLIVEKKTFKDQRGFLRELFKEKTLSNKFVFEILSNSKKNVLRGLHLQKKNPQEKYVTVLNGKVFDVVVDLRKNSKTFGKYFSIIISDKSDFSFFIPEGFAHGFLCLSKTCTINYKCSNYRNKESEITLGWLDRDVKIKWPVKKPILSKKDKKGLSLKSIKKLI